MPDFNVAIRVGQLSIEQTFKINVTSCNVIVIIVLLKVSGDLSPPRVPGLFPFAMHADPTPFSMSEIIRRMTVLHSFTACATIGESVLSTLGLRNPDPLMQSARRSLSQCRIVCLHVDHRMRVVAFFNSLIGVSATGRRLSWCSKRSVNKACLPTLLFHDSHNGSGPDHIAGPWANVMLA